MATTDIHYLEDYAYEREHKRNSAITTAIIMLLILLALFLFGKYRQNPPPGEKGIAVIFGTTDQGSGDEAPSSTNPDVERTPEEVEETDAQPLEEVTPTEVTPVTDVVTQTQIEAPVVAPTKPKPTPTPTKPVEKPKPTEPVKPAEQPKPAPPTPDPGSTFGGFKSDKNTSGGKGNDNVPGDKGNPNGTGTAWDGSGSGTVPGGNGDGYGLSGRSALKKIQPKNENKVLGTIRIKITVNSQGKVINAVYSSTGSTTADSYLKQISIDAAYKWEWSADPQNRPEQMGYIDFKYAAQ
jgi:outer membrane biosynthesis protein TonB